MRLVIAKLTFSVAVQAVATIPIPVGESLPLTRGFD